MLSVSSVNSYKPNFKAKTDNKLQNQVPMRAVGYNMPQQQMVENDKQRRRKLGQYLAWGAAKLLLPAAFIVMAIVSIKQYKLQKAQSEVMNMLDKGAPNNWQEFLNVVPKEEIIKHRGFDEMVQHKKIKTFWDNFLNRLKNDDFYSKGFGKRGHSMLFYGPPGTGKTEGGFALAKYFGDDAILNMIDCNALKSMWHGGSEGKIINSLKASTELCKQNPNKKVIVLIDEFSIANKAKGTNDNLITDMQDAFKAHLLDLIDQPNAIVIATTNHGAKGVPLDTFMDPAILDRFALKEYFPTPAKNQWMDLFKRRIEKFEKENVVEAGFFDKNKARFEQLAEKMEKGEASYRSYWLGVEQQVQNISASRFKDNNITGDARKILMEDFEKAVEKCSQEENWGTKLEEQGFTLENFIQGMLGALTKSDNAA